MTWMFLSLYRNVLVLLCLIYQFLVLIFSEWKPFLKVISDTYTSHGITYVFFNIFFISDFALKSLNHLKMIFSMAIHMTLISFFYMWASRFPVAFIKILSAYISDILVKCLMTTVVYIHDWVLFFYWSTFLLLYQYLTVLIRMLLYYILKFCV